MIGKEVYNSLINYLIDRYHALNERSESVRRFLATKQDLISKIDLEGKISKDITLPMKDLGMYGMRGNQAIIKPLMNSLN